MYQSKKQSAGYPTDQSKAQSRSNRYEQKAHSSGNLEAI
jgi:hypothetical protein